MTATSSGLASVPTNWPGGWRCDAGWSNCFWVAPPVPADKMPGAKSIGATLCGAGRQAPLSCWRRKPRRRPNPPAYRERRKEQVALPEQATASQVQGALDRLNTLPQPLKDQRQLWRHGLPRQILAPQRHRGDSKAPSKFLLLKAKSTPYSAPCCRVGTWSSSAKPGAITCAMCRDSWWSSATSCSPSSMPAWG